MQAITTIDKDPEFVQIVQDLESLVERVHSQVVRDPMSESVAIDLTKLVKTGLNKLDSKEEEFLKSFKIVIKVTQASVKPTREILKSLEAELKSKLIRYREEVESEQRKAIEKMEEEQRQAERKVIIKDIESLAKMIPAFQVGGEYDPVKLNSFLLKLGVSKPLKDLSYQQLTEIKESLLDSAKKEASGSKAEAKLEKIEAREMVIAPPPPIMTQPKTSQGSTGSISYKTVRAWEISDMNLIPREYMMLDTVKVGKVIKAGIEIPGIRSYEKKEAAIR